MLIAVYMTTKTSTAEAPTVEIPQTIDGKLHYFATLYNVSYQDMYKVAKCESSLSPVAVGDKNSSFGISQIHLPSHPEISKEQAINPDFAVEFMAKEFAKGNQKIWTCAKIMKVI